MRRRGQVLHPGRFAVMSRLDLEDPASRNALARWRQPGMLGVRVTFHAPPFTTLLTEDRVDWLWAEAEKHDIPMGRGVSEWLGWKT